MFRKALGFGLGFAAGWAGPEWVLALLAWLVAPDVVAALGALARRAVRRG